MLNQELYHISRPQLTIHDKLSYLITLNLMQHELFLMPVPTRLSRSPISSAIAFSSHQLITKLYPIYALLTARAVALLLSHMLEQDP